MKRPFKFSAIIALLFAVTAVMGAEPKVSIDEASKSIVIELDDPTFENQIRFIDMENHVIYSETVDKNEMWAKKLDLTRLPIGNYILKVENYLRTTEYKITVEKSQVSMAPKKIDHKPVFRKKDGRVFLNLLNSDLSPVDIKVRDAMDRLLFIETMKGTLNIQKSFNFTKAFKGSYTIKVKDGRKVYMEEIEIE